ncbi:MAG: ankyrin repeat domain-containing protein, partial [Verrucomicrobiota bacterium]|nr:ankyrin repeat domain-containing protein [Verrucomicrobiota bacterium]
PLDRTARSQKEVQEKLIGKGVDENEIALYGLTPLFLATMRGHLDIIELLLANGADVNAKNISHKTPLDLANLHKKAEIADLLRKASPLEQCSACKGTVNRSDKVCPHCGEPNPSL